MLRWLKSQKLPVTSPFCGLHPQLSPKLRCGEVSAKVSIMELGLIVIIANEVTDHHTNSPTADASSLVNDAHPN